MNPQLSLALWRITLRSYFSYLKLISYLSSLDLASLHSKCCALYQLNTQWQTYFQNINSKSNDVSELSGLRSG